MPTLIDDLITMRKEEIKIIESYGNKRKNMSKTTPQLDVVDETNKFISSTINSISKKIYTQNKEAGWYDTPRETGTRLMLIVSEIAEAMEGDRKNLMDDHLPHRKMLEVELADAIIRILDLAGYEGMDIGGATVEKLSYNKNRNDHKLENRNKEGGKKY